MTPFKSCLTIENGKLTLSVWTSAGGITPLGTRHERRENGEYFPKAVRDFFVNENSTNPEIAIAALEASQRFFDSHQNKPVKKKK